MQKYFFFVFLCFLVLWVKILQHTFFFKLFWDACIGATFPEFFSLSSLSAGWEGQSRALDLGSATCCCRVVYYKFITFHYWQYTWLVYYSTTAVQCITLKDLALTDVPTYRYKSEEDPNIGFHNLLWCDKILCVLEKEIMNLLSWQTLINT